MKKIWTDRRMALGMTGMLMLFCLANSQGVEATKAVALSIAGIVATVAASNAYEKKGKPDAPV